MKENTVIIYKQDNVNYSRVPPYNPSCSFPEYPLTLSQPDKTNDVYSSVREIFRIAGLDNEHYNTKEWNPLGEIINPGDVVVLKPNFVRDFHELHLNETDALITQGPVIRAMVDYTYIALKGEGRIIIADAPQDDADFEKILMITGIPQILELYRIDAHFNIECYDLRLWCSKKIKGVVVGREDLPGDPAGCTLVDLADKSEFAGLSNNAFKQLYGAGYDMKELHKYHNETKNEYIVSSTVLKADVIINLPKMKTHKKGGVTLSMKNIFGIIGNKNCLPHHREGTPDSGGDQFPSNEILHKSERFIVNQFKKIFPLLGPLRPLIAKPIKTIGTKIFGDTNKDKIRSGNWYGNDTVWRTILDVNKILRYADKNGKMHDSIQRKYISLLDGIIAGEGNGPLAPEPRYEGLLLFGMNGAAVDLAAASLMGFDINKIPILEKSLKIQYYPLLTFDSTDIQCISNIKEYTTRLIDLQPSIAPFKPHFGWKNHIEKTG